MKNAINANDALELSSKELDAVSGGFFAIVLREAQMRIQQRQADAVNQKQADALKGFKDALNSL